MSETVMCKQANQEIRALSCTGRLLSGNNYKMIKVTIRNPIRCTLRLYGKLIKSHRNESPRVEAPYDMRK